MFLRRVLRKPIAAALCTLLLLPVLSGCSAGDKTIIRIGHNQATDHPTNIALLAFAEFIESKLGDKYDVEVYPSELLGSQTDMVQLTQTGAIDFCVASNSILETFSKNCTPPVGNTLFVAIKVGKTSLAKTIPYMLWYYAAILIGLLLVTYVSAISMGLPMLAGLV